MKVTPKRRRELLKQNNIEAWIGTFVRRDDGITPIKFDDLLVRFLDDTKAASLGNESDFMEQLGNTFADALTKIWDLQVSINGDIPNAKVVEATHIGGKLSISIPSATIHYEKSGFNEKDLTTRGSITGGSACLFCCIYCSTPTILGRSPHTRILRFLGIKHRDAFIQRLDADATLIDQLTKKDGTPRYKDDQGVVILSPIVDPLSNEEVLEQSLRLILILMELTGWDVRILTKSLLIKKVMTRIPENYHHRIICGLSIGTLDDNIAKIVEKMTPTPTRRLKAYHELQQSGFRTYSMHCPILPQTDYTAYADRLVNSTNWEKDELVWCEALNTRGDSMANTIRALARAGYQKEAELLSDISGSTALWETQYNRPLFEALTAACPPGKLRYLVYPGKSDRDYWLGCRERGAVVLGKETQ